MLDPENCYNIIRCDRKNAVGGGVCTLLSKKFDIDEVPVTNDFPQLEVTCDILIGCTCCRLFNIYRKPTSDLCASVIAMEQLTRCLDNSSYLSGARCRLAYGPADATATTLTVSCFSKIQIGFTFLVPAHLGSPRQRAIKWACVCLEQSNKYMLAAKFHRAFRTTVQAAQSYSEHNGIRHTIAQFYELTGISRYYCMSEIALDVCWIQLR